MFVVELNCCFFKEFYLVIRRHLYLSFLAIATVIRLIAAGVTPSILEASPIVFGLLAESFSFTSEDSPSISTNFIVPGICLFRLFSFLLISRSCFFI